MIMSGRSTDHAKSGLTLLILTNVLIYLFLNDFHHHLNLHKTSGEILSTVYHEVPAHLLFNMLSLHRFGSEIFVHSSSRSWHSFFLVIVSYIICGIGAFVGVELKSQYAYVWEQQIQDARWRNRCNHWLCHSVNDALGLDVSSLFTNVWSDWRTSFRFADIKHKIDHGNPYGVVYGWMVMRLAYGAVYGWMGMRLMTSWMSPSHSRLDGMDFFLLTIAIAHDMSQSQLSLEDLKLSTLLELEEGSVDHSRYSLDHSVHLMGLVSGMMWALLLTTWEKVEDYLEGRSLS